MSAAAEVAFLQRLTDRSKGLNPIYDLWNGDLSAARAGYLDNLVNLTGPAALAAVLGYNTDVENRSSTVFAYLKAIDNTVKGLPS